MQKYQQISQDLRALEPDDAKKAMIEAVFEMSSSAKEDFVEKIGATMGRPSDNTRDFLWKLVVGAFVTVLVGSFATLALAVRFPPPKDATVQPELVLSLFTSVVGFLAGLFVPSPAKD